MDTELLTFLQYSFVLNQTYKLLILSNKLQRLVPKQILHGILPK